MTLPATAHTRTAHLRPGGERLVAKPQRLLRKEPRHTDLGADGGGGHGEGWAGRREGGAVVRETAEVLMVLGRGEVGSAEGCEAGSISQS